MRNKDYDKGQDYDLYRQVGLHDIICLSETHTDNDYSLNMPGFHELSVKIRPVCTKNNKYYGGMILMVRDGVRGGVEVLNNKFTDSILIRLDKDFFKLKNNLFIGFFYIIPSNSTYATNANNNTDPFEELDSFLHKYTEEGDILIMGDLNSRICIKPDYIPNDNNVGENDDFYEIDQVQVGRCSEDTNSNSQGPRLLDFCIGNRMRILNGRTLGDLEGKYTCHRPTGSSVVDYGISSEEFLDRIDTFTVHEYMGHLSDHCKISAQIRGSTRAKTREVRDKFSNKVHSENKSPSSYI